jgi:dihydropteroate synthase
MAIALPHGKTLDLTARPLVMGVVNVTPDSFSDGGRFFDTDRALAHAERLAAEGADIIDIGGESTRPGHVDVAAGEERTRVLPAIRAIAQRVAAPISIDTTKAAVARDAVAAGASIINDVWGFQRDPDIAAAAAESGALCVLMHNREHEDPAVDIIADMLAFLERSLAIARKAGVQDDKIVLDPGVGFGRTAAQSLTCIRRLGELRALGFPVLVGASRKRVIGRVTGRTDPLQRGAGSLGAALAAVARGAAVIRAHDVAEHVDAIRVFMAVDRPDGLR